MLQEWDKTQPAAWLTAMGLQAYVEALRNANAQVKAAISGRQGEQSMIIRGELREARNQVDETLQQLLRYIDALNVTSPSEELTDLILKLTRHSATWTRRLPQESGSRAARRSQRPRHRRRHRRNRGRWMPGMWSKD